MARPKAQEEAAPVVQEKFYCEAVALKNWNCDFNGYLYDFKKGDVVKIKYDWHLEKLTHPQIMAVKRP